MLRTSFSKFVVPAAAIALLVFAGQGRAQYFFRPYATGLSDYGSVDVVPEDTTISGQYEAAYPPDEDEAVNLTIRVPATARIWFNGKETKQGGTVRRFISPPLVPGNNYAYEIRVNLRQNGQEITQVRRIAVQPGDRIDLNFLGQ
jgi:uncharacterized protein (TIGR03000 family)